MPGPSLAGNFQLPPRLVVGAEAASATASLRGNNDSSGVTTAAGPRTGKYPSEAAPHEPAAPSPAFAGATGASSATVAIGAAHEGAPPTTGKGKSGGGPPSKKGQPWTESEHLAFISGLRKLGKGNWRGISRYYVPTRTPTQVASHAQKHFMRLNGVTKRKSRFSLLEQAVACHGILNLESKGVNVSAQPVHAPIYAAASMPKFAAAPGFPTPMAVQSAAVPPTPFFSVYPALLPAQPIALMPAPLAIAAGSPVVSLPPFTFRNAEPVHCSQPAPLLPIKTVPPLVTAQVVVHSTATSAAAPASVSPPKQMPPPIALSKSLSSDQKPLRNASVCRPTATASQGAVKKEKIDRALRESSPSSSLWAGKPSTHSAFQLPKVPAV